MSKFNSPPPKSCIQKAENKQTSCPIVQKAAARNEIKNTVTLTSIKTSMHVIIMSSTCAKRLKKNPLKTVIRVCKHCLHTHFSYE